MPTVLQRIQQQLQQTGLTERTEASRQWLLSLMPSLKVTPATILKDRASFKNRALIGRMYFFRYLAAGRDDLPYYDKFPLVIPIEQYHDGFLGLNLHYLPPKIRLILLNKLSELSATPGRYDERTRLRISYQVLVSHARLFEHTPTIKRYLYPQIRSRFVEVEASQWDIAAMLPTASFVGASISEVHADSRKKIQERNS
jgi:hypothetical protein